MIDHESFIFNAVSEALRTEFEHIFITGVELVNTPPQFPAVSIVQKNTEVNKRYSTFDQVENVTSEEYEFGVFSNLEHSRDAKEQTKAIISVIDRVMATLFYPRTFCQSIVNADTTITRHIARYAKNNVTTEV